MSRHTKKTAATYSRARRAAGRLTRPLTSRWGSRRDEGNMFLALLFTMIMVGITLAVTTSSLTGINKTRDARDFALALEAADTAFADVLMSANTQPKWFQDHMGSGQAFTSVRNATTGATHQGSGTVGAGNQVRWSWKVSPARPGQPLWTIDVAVQGPEIDRHFTATMRGNQVLQTGSQPGGTHVKSSTADFVHYLTTQSQGYQYGFFGDGAARADLGNLGVRFTDNGTTRFPDVDGYNGESGIIASNGRLELGSTHTDTIKQWNWKSASTCTGTACTSPSVERQTIPARASFSDKDLMDHCASPVGAWNASTGGALVAGRCYTSLNFNANYTAKVSAGDGSGVVYVTGDVYVADGVLVNGEANTKRSDFNVPATGLRIALNGNYTQRPGSHVAAAILAANRLTSGRGICTITANATGSTTLMGAATCERLDVAGPVRLRVDGGLKSENVRYDATRPTLPMIFVVDDLRPID